MACSCGTKKDALPCGAKVVDTEYGPRVVEQGCAGATPTLDSMTRRIDAPGSVGTLVTGEGDPRVALIRSEYPDLKLDGKSDGYLDAMADIIRGRHADERRQLADMNRATAPNAGGAGSGPAKSRLDEAHERADAEARNDFKAGPPRNAMFVRGDATAPGAAPTRSDASPSAVNTDGMSSIEAAHARADAEARKDFASAAPEGALFVRRP